MFFQLGRKVYGVPDDGVFHAAFIADRTEDNPTGGNGCTHS
jgi:hypothetical protein